MCVTFVKNFFDMIQNWQFSVPELPVKFLLKVPVDFHFTFYVDSTDLTKAKHGRIKSQIL